MKQDYRILLIFCGLLFLGLTVGCAEFPGNQPPGSSASNDSRDVVEGALESLRENFERRRLMQFSDGVHPDYRRYQTSLRNNLSDVYRVYSSIQLEFFGSRTTKSNGTVVVESNWNLRWTCQSPRGRAPSGCRSSSDVGNVIIRRGRTAFEFARSGGEWKLLNQSGDLVFGSLAPGSVR